MLHNVKIFAKNQPFRRCLLFYLLKCPFSCVVTKQYKTEKRQQHGKGKDSSMMMLSFYLSVSSPLIDLIYFHSYLFREARHSLGFFNCLPIDYCTVWSFTMLYWSLPLCPTKIQIQKPVGEVLESFCDLSIYSRIEFNCSKGLYLMNQVDRVPFITF